MNVTSDLDISALEATAANVRHCYWELDVNCAKTTLYALAAQTGLVLEPQLCAAATGMHGAGRFGAQCGLVEGALMFWGVLGAHCGLSAKAVEAVCNDYARAFTERFGSLECRVLRPNGFQKNDPPHACEGLTLDTVRFALAFWQARHELCRTR